MTGLDAYRALVVGVSRPLASLPLAIADAVGCIAVADVVAPPVPAVAVAACDGYAVRAADTVTAPLTLQVTHDAEPGVDPGVLVPGTAVRIASGAPMPMGADAVVAVQGGAARVMVPVPFAAGASVRVPGAHLAGGEVIVAAGSLIGAGQVAALAAAGVRAVEVRPPVRVAMLAVGSELAADTGAYGRRGHQPMAAAAGTGRAPGPEVKEASTALLRALVAGDGARVTKVATVPDESAAIRVALEDAFADAEVVITIGGTSGGFADVVVPVLQALVNVQMHQVGLVPGGSHGYGTAVDDRDRQVLLLALPGAPAAVAAAYAGYVRDALAAVRGVQAPLASAPAGAAYTPTQGSVNAVPVAHVDGQAVPLGEAGNPRLGDLAAAHGIALVDGDGGTVVPGQRVHVAWWRA